MEQNQETPLERPLEKALEELELERELEKYYFFFIVWYFTPECGSVEHPIPSLQETGRGDLDFFIFPITTKEELDFFLTYGETKRSQVAALEMTENWRNAIMDHLQGDHNQTFYFPHELTIEEKEEGRTKGLSLGNTKTFIERIKQFGTKGVCRYIGEICMPVEDNYLDPYGQIFEPDVTQGPKFSDPEEMFNLLKGEHKVMLGFDDAWDQIFYILPENYSKIPNKTPGEDLNEDLEASYASLTKSLFKPRWGNWGDMGEFNELTPAKYEELLIPYTKPQSE